MMKNLLLRLCLAGAVLPVGLVPSENLSVSVETMLQTGVPSQKIQARPSHPVLKGDRLGALTEAISIAAYEKSVPAYLLLAIAFREGSFMPQVIGKIGERTTFQLAPSTINRARELDSRCDPDSDFGAAFCAASWLSYCFSTCGTWEGAVAFYASGRTCSLDNERIRWIVEDRISLAFWFSAHCLP